MATFSSMDYIVIFEHEEEVAHATPNLAILKTLDLRGVIGVKVMPKKQGKKY